MEGPQSHSALNNLKTIIREYEKLESSDELIKERRLAISENLKSTIEMLGDSKGGTFSHISALINQYTTNSKLEMEIFENSIVELKNSLSLDKVMKQHFVEKVHTFRQSLLSTMLITDKNISALYYLLVTFFIWLVVWVFADDIASTGTMDVGRFGETFKGLSIACGTWITMYLYSLLITVFIKVIDNLAILTGKINYWTIFSVYLVYQIVLYVFATVVIRRCDLAMAVRTIISCEMARLSLKIHSYFREKVLYGMREYHNHLIIIKDPKGKDDKLPDIKIDTIDVEVRRFIFFSFCPSLIYRDKYPRLITYRYDMILAHLTNFILCLLCLYFLSRYICSPYFTMMKLRNYYSITYFCYDCCRLAIPGTFFLITGFFLLLHTWQNLWSELLRYGDRRFYEDWWNCTNFEEWYRKWNMVVHEWLYYYVYNDVIRLTGTKSRLICKICVFSLSVAVHEVIVWHTIGFFFPILSFFFGGPGLIFTYIKPTKKQFNVLFWIKLFIGLGILFCMFLMEVNLRDVVDNGIGFECGWHSYLPRSILIYFQHYRNKIAEHALY